MTAPFLANGSSTHAGHLYSSSCRPCTFFGERDDLIVGIVESMRESEEKHM